MENDSKNIEQLKKAIKNAETILIGAGAGLSTSAGMLYSGEEFQKNFAILLRNINLRTYILLLFLILKTSKNFGHFGVDLFIMKDIQCHQNLYIKIYIKLLKIKTILL